MTPPATAPPADPPRPADRAQVGAAVRELGLPDELAERIARYASASGRGGVPVLVACDLDRTLIYSGAALGLCGPDAAAPALVVTEVYRGLPLSFCTRSAQRILAALCAVAQVVPVTTRTVAQYARVRLLEQTPSYAVTSNGGRILLTGRTDEDWSARIAARLDGECAPLGSVRDHLERTADPLWMRRQHVADDLFCYAVVERAELPAAFVADLAGWCGEQGWTVSLQGRKLYCVPRALTKSAAVAELLQRVGGARLLAAGDSLLDADLLAAADEAVRPAHGELHQIGWRAGHVTVTEQSGVLGGEEVAARLLAAALAYRCPDGRSPAGSAGPVGG